MCTSWCASMCEQLIWICRVLGLGRLDGGAAGPVRKSLITAVRTMFIYVQMRRVDHKHHHGDLPITHKLTSPSHCRRGHLLMCRVLEPDMELMCVCLNGLSGDKLGRELNCFAFPGKKRSPDQSRDRCYLATGL
jgi:hypothetical protein